ncbi:MAG: hypothetical protein IPL28_18295 [Chloroflexi bacterium]|nr:hypothetical protein [Chloroflexota bacterium]
MRFWPFFLLVLLACQLETAVPLLSPVPLATAVPAPVAATMPAPPAIPTPPPTAAPLVLPPVEAGAATMPVLRVGELVTGRVGGGNPPQWEIRLTAGDDFLVWVQPQEGLEAVVQLSREGERENLVNLATADPAGAWAFLTAGETSYTLRVAGSNGSEGTFRLGVLDWQRAAVLAVEGAVAEDEVASYRLPFTAGQTVLFWLEPVGAWDGVLELYAPAGFVLARDESGEGARKKARPRPKQVASTSFACLVTLGKKARLPLRIFCGGMRSSLSVCQSFRLSV